MHWIITFILGAIAGAAAVIIWLVSVIHEVTADKQREQVDELTGKTHKENGHSD